ncbi:MAG: diacylglycerol kinase family lipid kinase [Lachnospiraceae bacterium]|nr:diacylglycerol kinase family lipid kinase [Lachnospiraceae bacterium]MBQ9563886.1 diacylglycerol kinase family lipid kinase [Lachnospiraceae bacterium]
MKKLLFIVNPKAGKMTMRNHVLAVCEEFRRGGYEINFVPTLAKGEAVDIVASRGAEYDLIVCSGGDGTLDEVVAGTQIGQMDVPIGYIPAGSTNDYAKSLKLPVTPETAARLIMKGTPRAVDVGVMNDQFFIYVAAFGSIAQVSYSTGQEKKNALGHLAYVLDGAVSMLNLKSYHMTISCNATTISGEFIHGMITNSVSVGGFKSIVSSQTKLNDGLFEVVLVRKPKDPTEYPRILSSFLLGDTSAPEIVFLQTSELGITCDEPVEWALDGEFGGAFKETYIENKKQRIRIVCK